MQAVESKDGKGGRTLRNNAGNRSVPPNPRIVTIPDDYWNLHLVVINVSTNCFHIQTLNKAFILFNIYANIYQFPRN